MHDFYSNVIANTITALEGLSPEHFLNLITLILKRYRFNLGVYQFIQTYCKERRVINEI